VPDDLVRLLNFDARYGAGLDRGLVLGGGGVFQIAWQTGYLATAVEAGIDLRQADRIVGTSAGSLVGAVLAARRIAILGMVADLLARASSVVSYLAPVGDLAPSQQHALDMMMTAENADPETIKAIGHAAMAAATPSARTMRRNIAVLVDYAWWPSSRLWVTAVDALTAERVVITKQTGVRPTTAVAASCALPGLYAPQLIHDRRCMDGGLSGTGTNSDLVAGARRAVVLSLAPGDRPLDRPMAAATTHFMLGEMAALRDSGTEVFHRWAPMRPDLDMMSPDTMGEGLAAGRAQGAEDLDELREFWAA
jgi:NTE family protein